MKYELLPHHESPSDESEEPPLSISKRRAQAVSPFQIQSDPILPGEDVELAMLSPVLDTFELVNPKGTEETAISTEVVDPKKHSEEKPQYDILWVNPNATIETPTDPQPSSSPPPAVSDDVSPHRIDLDTPFGGDPGATGMTIDVNSIFANSAAVTSSAEETTLL